MGCLTASCGPPLRLNLRFLWLVCQTAGLFIEPGRQPDSASQELIQQGPDEEHQPQPLGREQDSYGTGLRDSELRGETPSAFLVDGRSGFELPCKYEHFGFSEIKPGGELLHTAPILDFGDLQPACLRQGFGARKRIILRDLPMDGWWHDDFTEQRRQEVKPADP